MVATPARSNVLPCVVGDSHIDIREYYHMYGKLKTEEHFDQLDKNEDGKLTHEEIHGYHRPGTQLPGVYSID